MSTPAPPLQFYGLYGQIHAKVVDGVSYRKLEHDFRQLNYLASNYEEHALVAILEAWSLCSESYSDQALDKVKHARWGYGRLKPVTQAKMYYIMACLYRDLGKPALAQHFAYSAVEKLEEVSDGSFGKLRHNAQKLAKQVRRSRDDQRWLMRQYNKIGRRASIYVAWK